MEREQSTSRGQFIPWIAAALAQQAQTPAQVPELAGAKEPKHPKVTGLAVRVLRLHRQ